MARVLIACSGFKDVLPAAPLCDVLRQALLVIDKNLSIVTLPLSDGGEGFLQAFSSAYPGSKFIRKAITVTGPLGSPIAGEYGVIEETNKKIGVVELAKLSGIEYVPNAQRNPYFTTSHGTGEAIQELYSHGIRDIYLGLGGSATTDGGLSVLYPLEGLKFEFSVPLPDFITGIHLGSITSISANENSDMLSSLNVTIACDVNNPMLGPSGSVNIFGPQKGLLPSMLEEYEQLMCKVNDILISIQGRNIGNTPHSGAAGGVAGGIMAAFQNCTVKRGIDIISEVLHLEAQTENADFVITGEGCFDSQTKGGKVVSKIKELRPDCIIVCGINKSAERERVFDLQSRYGERSITEVRNCLELVAQEIYNKIIHQRLL